MTGFRFALVLENGEAAAPAVFATVIPTWHVGDEFLAAGIRKFRILAIDPEMDDDAPWHAVWVVEPVDEVSFSDLAPELLPPPDA